MRYATIRSAGNGIERRKRKEVRVTHSMLLR
jgi:hypothetical protein